MIENYEYKIIGAIVNFKDKRALIIYGIDFGYANPSYLGLPVLKETEHYILCRIRGGSGRVSLGSFSYHSPRYIIFEKNVIDGEKVIKNPLGDWEFEYSKDTMKKRKQIAFKKIEEMESKK